MALNIKSEEVDKLAREAAERSGLSITEAVKQALLQMLERLGVEADNDDAAREARIDALIERISKLPVKDDRPIDELLGYNEDGTWD